MVSGESNIFCVYQILLADSSSNLVSFHFYLMSYWGGGELVLKVLAINLTAAYVKCATAAGSVVLDIIMTLQNYLLDNCQQIEV
jgi:hypothetical protein